MNKVSFVLSEMLYVVVSLSLSVYMEREGRTAKNLHKRNRWVHRASYRANPAICLPAFKASDLTFPYA